MSNRSSRRGGFTLAEVLVTVAIVAVLAAIVVPTVTSQISKGDDSQLATSISNVRTGITAFISDTRKFPGRISDLFNTILDTDDDLSATDYGTAAVARWRGPYISGSMASADSLPVGLGYLRSALKDSSFATATGHVIVTISGVYTSATALRIDSLIDGATGQTTGSLRWRTPVGVAVPDSSLKLLLMGAR